MDPVSLTAAARAGAANVARSWRLAWGGIGGATLLVALAVATAHEPWSPVVLLGACVWLCQASAACYRVALDRTPLGLAGVRAGRDVTRLIMVAVLQAILFVVMTLLGSLLIGGVAYGVSWAQPGFKPDDIATWTGANAGSGQVIVDAVGVAVLAGLIWMKARLALASAATVDREKVQVLSAWSLTRRMTLAVVAAMAAAAAPVVALGALVHLVLPPAPIPPPERLLLGLALGLTLCGLALPLNAGLMTYLYRRSPTNPQP